MVLSSHSLTHPPRQPEPASQPTSPLSVFPSRAVLDGRLDTTGAGGSGYMADGRQWHFGFGGRAGRSGGPLIELRRHSRPLLFPTPPRFSFSLCVSLLPPSYFLVISFPCSSILGIDMQFRRRYVLNISGPPGGGLWRLSIPGRPRICVIEQMSSLRWSRRLFSVRVRVLGRQVQCEP